MASLIMKIYIRWITSYAPCTGCWRFLISIGIFLFLKNSLRICIDPMVGYLIYSYRVFLNCDGHYCLFYCNGSTSNVSFPRQARLHFSNATFYLQVRLYGRICIINYVWQHDLAFFHKRCKTRHFENTHASWIISRSRFFFKYLPRFCE